MKTIMIHEMPDHLGETVRIGSWLANKRSSGKIGFLQLRDGSGFVQGVVVKEEVGEDIFAKARSPSFMDSFKKTTCYFENKRRSDSCNL